VFALTVLLCDDYVTIKPSLLPNSQTARFFQIAAKLPMDLQGILALRSQRSAKVVISSKRLEFALRKILLQ